MSIANWMLAEL